MIFLLSVALAAPHMSELVVRTRYMPTFPPGDLAPQRCLVAVYIHPSGTPYDAQVNPSCLEPYARAATAAAMKWRWEPPRDGDQPVRAHTVIAFSFVPATEKPTETPDKPAPATVPVEVTLSGEQLAISNVIEEPVTITALDKIDGDTVGVNVELLPGEVHESQLTGPVIVQTSRGNVESDLSLYTKAITKLDDQNLGSDCLGLVPSSGYVQIRLTIGPDGQVTDARLLHTTMPTGPRVEKCLLEVVRKAHVPIRPKEPLEVDYPFAIAPNLKRL
jgi:hypothetical protein